MRIRRFLAAVVALPCLALLFGGCLVFTVEPSATAPPLGPVVIRATICASDASAPITTGCRNDEVFTGDANGNSNTDRDQAIGNGSTVPTQVLLGYRVPAGASSPASFAAGRLTFTPDSSYTAELQRLAPAAAGFRWFGYASRAFVYDPGAPGQLTRVTAAAPFELPRNPDGTPFEGPFRYRVVVGFRGLLITPGPLRCGDDLFEYVDLDYICVDAPSPATLGTNRSVQTRDLTLAPGSEVTVRPGETATVRYTARYAGAPATFGVSAGTGLPGATAAPSAGSLTPADGSVNPLSVNVAVPAGAAPGRYPVTLTAALGGRSRTGTGTIVVPAPPSPPPPPPPPPPSPPSPPARILSPVQVGWEVRGKLTKVQRLRVRLVPDGATVRASCAGDKRCPFRVRRFKGRNVNVGKHFRKRLRPGAIIEIRITAAGAIGKLVRYETRRRKLPRTTVLCIPAGRTRGQKRC
jgi:hypothetical protein